MEVQKNTVSQKLKVRKKIWIFIAYLLVLSLLAQPALALTANVRIEGPDNTIFDGDVNVPQSITLQDSTGKNVTIDGYYQVNALVAAANTGAFNFSVTDTQYGLSLDSINGISDPTWTRYWAQRLNWATSIGISVTPIANGDFILIHYSTFDSNYAPEKPLRLEVSKTDPKIDEQFTVTTTYFDDNDGTFKPISANIAIESQSYQTDSDGKIVVSIPKDGTYKIFATKAGYVKSNKVTVVAGKIVSNPPPVLSSPPMQDKAPIIVNKSVRIQSSHKSIKYLKKLQSKNGSFENPATSAWVAMALAALSKKKIDIKRGKGKSLLQNLATYNPKLLTDYARQILAVVALGKNPRYFGRKNLVWKMRDLFYKNDPNLLNDDNFTALALLAAKTPNRRLARKIINSLVSNQNPDGGFSYSKSIKASDVDDTAATIQTLAAAKKQGYANVDEAINKAINFLKASQNDNGGFGFTKTGAYKNPNSISTAWAIQAIISAGQNPDNWAKLNGATPFSYLASCQNADGSFSYTVGGAKLTLATAYAIPALLSKAWPIRWINY